MLAQQHAIMIVLECESSFAFFFWLWLFQNVLGVDGGIQSTVERIAVENPDLLINFRPSSAIFAHRCPYESAAELGPIVRCTTAKRCCAVCKHVHFCNVCLQTSAFSNIQHRDRCLGRQPFCLKCFVLENEIAPDINLFCRPMPVSGIEVTFARGPHPSK